MSNEIKNLAQRRGQRFAQAILKHTKAIRKWAKLLESEDENIQIKALIYLTDRAYGKATEYQEHTGENGGPIVHTIRFGNGSSDGK